MTAKESVVISLIRSLIQTPQFQPPGAEKGEERHANSATNFAENEAHQGAEAAHELERQGLQTSIWHGLAEEGVKPAIVARAFSVALSSSGLTRKGKLETASFYASLLAMKGTPVLGLFDEIAWSCTISIVRHFFAEEKRCTLILENLSKAVTESTNLKTFETSITTTVETLAPLSREIKLKVDDESGECIEVEVTDLWKESLSALYKFLNVVVKPKQGFRRSSAVVLMRSIQPVLVLSVSDRRAPTKVKFWLREAAIDFLKVFASDSSCQEHVASKTVGALARHCCIRAPENAESREHASVSVSRLVSFLPAEEACDFTKFLIKMCRHPQTNQRVFALEVVQSLAEDCFTGDEQSSIQSMDWTSLVVQGILDRALDKVSLIRVKAINCLAFIFARISESQCGNAITRAIESKENQEGLTRKIVSLAISRSRDSKPTVRKAALNLLESALPQCHDLDPKAIQAITCASHDTFVSVRRQAVVTASALFNSFSEKECASRMWLQVILPLSVDTEQSIQSRCQDSFQKDFLSSISNGKGKHFVQLIASENNFALLLRKVMSMVKLTHSQLSKVARVVQNEIQAIDMPSEQTGYWVILSETVAKYPSLVSGDLIHRSLKELDRYLPAAKTLARVMQTIRSSAKSLNQEILMETSKLLTEKLRTFCIPIDAISHCLATLNELSKNQQKMLLEHVAQSAEGFFKSCIGKKGLTGPETRKLASAIFTMGELSLLKSFDVSSGVITLVQSMTSDRLLGLDVKIPSTIQAHSWACLGKFCVKDEELAKKLVPLFFHEIRNTTVSAVRNNIMLILADLCTKYTSLVDTHIGEIAKCFEDPSEVVRRQTLIVLASLLQQDFLKWRGPIFHCFVLSLVDDEISVRSLGGFLLSTSLGSTASQLAYNFFVKTMYTLNACPSAGSSTSFIESAALVDTTWGIKADLAGIESAFRAKRKVIYDSLLKLLTPEHKFKLAAKLCEDCIGPLLHENDSECHSEVLRDAMIVLGCCTKEIGRIPGILSAMMPLIVELKGHLEASKSPLLKEVMDIACGLLKEHKNEVEDLLVEDPTFASEILQELKSRSKSNNKISRNQNSRSESTPPGTGSKTPLVPGTSSKTPLAAEVLQDVLQEDEPTVRRLSSLFNAAV